MKISKSKTKMGSIDFILFSTIMLLVAIGVVMVYSASSYKAFFDKSTQDSMFFLKRQGLWAIIGTFFMFLTIKFDYKNIKKYTKLLMIISVICLLAVFAFESTKGAQRWIRVGSVGFQPSEIAKYIVVLYMAKSIEVKGGRKIGTLLYGVIPYLLVSGFYAGLVFAEKNLSIAAVIMIVTMIVLYVSGARITHMIGVVGLVILAGIAGIIFEPYRMARFTSFLNPWADPKGNGYQLIQSLLAMGSGGIWGVGLGRSRQKCYYIPEPHNDFIFSIIGEELGLIGCTIIVALFIVIVWRGIVTAIKAKDTYGTLLATGITSVIAVQAIINIAVVTGSMPVTGVPLPFISYGGSSLVINMVAMGILLNISRQSEYG
ncbi:factor for spore cortex peptidoglycan synthesis (stage V sporulation) [Clostridiaceae bacterium BL-3]|mgnify:FL=1|nr:stage V sporulation protein E [Clostridium sp. HV4-5-A1G]CAB1242238.1 factor for spore cortex peptidoglycan synthesis (stage V sporulation) [Clostridiaceae bacterium BL-3]